MWALTLKASTIILFSTNPLTRIYSPTFLPPFKLEGLSLSKIERNRLYRGELWNTIVITSLVSLSEFVDLLYSFRKHFRYCLDPCLDLSHAKTASEDLSILATRGSNHVISFSIQLRLPVVAPSARHHTSVQRSIPPWRKLDWNGELRKESLCFPSLGISSPRICSPDIPCDIRSSFMY